MHAKVLNERPELTIVLILEKGEEVMAALQQYASERQLAASRLTAIGAFESAVLGYFDRTTKDYLRIPVDEQVEVLSLIGDVACAGNESKVHVHAVLGRRDGSTVGGHLLEARVHPTLEAIITNSPAHLQRQWDRETGLTLIRLE